MMIDKRKLNSNIRQLAMSLMNTIVRIAVIAVCFLIITKAGKYAYDFGFRIFTEEPMSSAPGRDVSVTIVQGDSLMDTCKMFEEKGLVRDAKLTWVQKKVSVYNDDIEPGFYTLNTSMTADEMFEIIAGKKGDDDEEDELTIETGSSSPGTDEGLSQPDALVETPLSDDSVQVNNPFDEVGDPTDEGTGETDDAGDTAE